MTVNPADRNKRLARKERPDDLFPVISDVYAAWVTSAMTVREVAPRINTKPGNLYSWFQGRGRPDIRVFDDLLGEIGWRFEIVDDNRRETAALRAEAANVPHSRNTNVAEPAPDAHPLIWDWYNAWKPSGVDFESFARLAGLNSSTLYRWRAGEGVPTPVGIETSLNVISKRLKVVRGTRLLRSQAAR